VADQISREAF
jgi:hypothetical protein